MKLGVIIPAYNEENTITNLVKSLLSLSLDGKKVVEEVIVIDDGSSDNTLETIKQHADCYTQHCVNLGQGAALKTGTELAYNSGYEYIIHSDADGQFRIEDIKNLIETLENSDHEIVIGSRFMDSVSDSMPLRKKTILNMAKIFSKLFLKLKFSDPQCGLRGFKREAYKKILWKSNDFQHCTEILGLIAKNKLNYKEIPIVVQYDDYSTNKTVKPKISMGWKILMSKLFN